MMKKYDDIFVIFSNFDRNISFELKKHFLRTKNTLKKKLILFQFNRNVFLVHAKYLISILTPTQYPVVTETYPIYIYTPAETNQFKQS